MMADVNSELEALASGRAWVDLSALSSAFEVSGSGSERFLGDLIAGPVARLAPGEGTRSLLLTPTGRIRADLWVARRADDRFLLIQDSDQPDSIEVLLSRYILGADVRITASDQALISLPAGSLEGLAATPSDIDAGPSPLDPECRLLAFDAAGAGADQPALSGLVLVGREALEIHRVRAGIARFPVDLTTGSLPAEDQAALSSIDRTKGCFLGQESVAKVANLGHPTYTIRALSAEGYTQAGEDVLSEGGVVGVLTSVVPASEPPANDVIARLSWSAASSPTSRFETASGGVLASRTPVR